MSDSVPRGQSDSAHAIYSLPDYVQFYYGSMWKYLYLTPIAEYNLIHCINLYKNPTPQAIHQQNKVILL